MAARTVDITLTVAQARALQNLLAVDSAIKNLGTSLDDMGKKGGKGGGAAAKSLGDVATQAGKAALAFAGIGGAIQGMRTLAGVLKSELEKIKNIRIESLDRQVLAGQAIEQFRLRTGGVFKRPGEQTAAINAILDSRDDLTQAEAMRVAGVGISSGSGDTVLDDGRKFGALDRAKVGTRVSNVLRSFDEETRDSATAAVIALVETFKGKGTPQQVADQHLGTVLSALTFSPSIEPKSLTDNITAAAAQLGSDQLGFSEEDAISTLLGIQGSTRDVQGATTRTNVINQAIRAFQRVSEVKPELRGQGQRMFDFLSASGEFAEDPQALAENRRLLGALSDQFTGLSEDERDTLLSGDAGGVLTARAKGFLGVMEFFQPGDNLTKRKARAAREEVLFGPEAGAFVEGQLQTRGTETAGERSFESSRAAERARDIALSDNEGAARSGEILKLLTDVGPLFGESGLASGLRKNIEALSDIGDPVEVTRRQIDILERIRTGATTTSPDGMARFGGSTPASMLRTDDLTPRQRTGAQAGIADRAITEQLERLNRIMEAQLEEQRLIREAAERPTSVNVENDNTRQNQAPAGAGAGGLGDR